MATHTQAILDKQGPRANICIRTEAGLNVASTEFLSELEQVVDQLSEDSSIRFVVINASGKVFLAGANIKAMAEFDVDQAREMAELGHRVFDKIEALPQPTIAALHGAALGGGCELALACDFRIAVRTTNIGQPEVLLGLIPGWGGTLRLAQYVPFSFAKKLMFSGDSIKAEEALKHGLVDDVVNSEEDLEPLVAKWIDRMVKASPTAIAAVKAALLTGQEIDEFADCFSRDEAKLGMKAFLEKAIAPWAS